MFTHLVLSLFHVSPYHCSVPISLRPALHPAEAVPGLHCLRQLCWCQPDCLLGVAWDAQRHSDVIVELSVQLEPKAEFVQW